jgi:O-antigen/teichoic acid export membrane protein
MSTATKYAKETFWAVASKGVAFIFYYSLVYYLTRKMTVEIWGEWSAFLALLNIVMLVSDLGINSASKRYIAQVRDAAELGGVVRTTFVLRVLASLIYTLLIALAIHPLLGWLRQPEYLGLMQRSLLLVALYGIMDYFKHLFEALHRLRFTFVVSVLEHGLKFLLVIVLFKGGEQFIAIVTAFTVAVGIAMVGGLFFTLQTIPRVLVSSGPPKLMRKVFLYSLPVFLMSIGSFFALEIDTIMLKNMRTAYDTGIYSAAKTIVIFLPHLSIAFSMGFIPGLAVFDATDALAKRRIFYRVLGVLTGTYLLIDFALAGFAMFGLDLFFEKSYEAAAIPLLTLTPFVLFSGISTYCGNLLDYRGLAWTRSMNFVFTIIANVVLNWWWIPKWGAVGAAAASSVAFAPYCALNLWQAHAAFAANRLSKV